MLTMIVNTFCTSRL